MSHRDYPIIEDDLRLPEFRKAKLEDLERREDGKIVRKDRWQTAMLNIQAHLPAALRKREFEIPDVVEAVHTCIKAERALMTLYARLCAEQLSLGEPDPEATEASLAKRKHRCEGITAAIRLLTDEAGNAGVLIRAVSLDDDA